MRWCRDHSSRRSQCQHSPGAGPQDGSTVFSTPRVDDAGLYRAGHTKIIDEATAPISKINAELKKRMATANALGKSGGKLDLGNAVKGTDKADASVKKL
jgi:hypothetical protein